MLDRILELRRQLFSDSLRLVVSLMARYGKRMDFATGVLRGALGLDKAIDRFEPELPWITADDPDEELRLNTTEYNRVLERFVLEHPEQWFWMHRRWKPDFTPWT